MKDNRINEKIKIIPLGGLDKIGMNITAFEYQDSIVIVDCGVSFPDEEMLGIDLVIPDVSYLVEHKDKVKGFVITHGHEDHIGALPYILPNLNVPVYATELTMGLINHKLKEHGLTKKVKRKVIKHGGSVNLGEFRIEFIKTNHSIAQASALAITSPAGVIFHTGDFKIDYTPLFGDAIDLQRFAYYGKKGVLALLCDSTNAVKPGFTMSEQLVAKSFEQLFHDHKKQRLIVATFASNVDRVQQVMNTAHQFGRKVILQGRSMLNVISIASEMGYVKVPENTLIEVDEMKRYPDEQLVFITTGSQGESMAALSRMADGSHKKVHIKPGDVIVFSSTPIPGNVKAVNKVMNELAIRGAELVYQDTHVSGHACQEEIKLVYSLLKPKYIIPVHGDYSHLCAQAALAYDFGYDKEHVMLLQNGDIAELSQEKAEVVGSVPAKALLVDGLGIGDVGNKVLNDRHELGENGIIIVAVVLQKSTGVLMSGPDVVSRGFVYIRESEVLMKELRATACAIIDKEVHSHASERKNMIHKLKDGLSQFLWKKMKRHPVIIPVIEYID